MAAFIIESYKRLSSDSGAATVLLLNQISQQLSTLSNGTQVSSPPPLYTNSPFRPAQSAIRINILWFLSLTISLICALAATLMQQWSRRYLQQARAQPMPYKRARKREYLFQGVEAFRLSQAVEAVPALLHLAVFLFFAGLVDFLFSIDSTVGHVIFGVICFFSGIYILLTFLPNIRSNCPYRTPFSRDSLKWLLIIPKWLLVIPAASVILCVSCLRCFIRSERFKVRMHLKSLWWTMFGAMQPIQEDLDRSALQRTVAAVDDDDDIEAFIEGIPGFLKAETNSDALPIVKGLLDLKQPKPLGHHITRLIQMCTADGYRGANEKLRRRRALICLDTLRILTASYTMSFSYEMFGDKTWPSVYLLEQDKDPLIAINAISTGALAACAYLHFVFKSRGQAPGDRAARETAETSTHIYNLRRLVNAPWHKADLDSFPECHLLVLQGFVSGLLHHLTSDKVTPTSFHVVWETLPQILSMAPLGDSNPQFRESFLALWTQLENLPGNKRDIDADLPPIIQLMSMLHPTVESIRAQQARYITLRKTVRKIAGTRQLPEPPS